jgi:hypothetical protein
MGNALSHGFRLAVVMRKSTPRAQRILISTGSREKRNFLVSSLRLLLNCDCLSCRDRRRQRAVGEWIWGSQFGAGPDEGPPGETECLHLEPWFVGRRWRDVALFSSSRQRSSSLSALSRHCSRRPINDLEWASFPPQCIAVDALGLGVG